MIVTSKIKLDMAQQGVQGLVSAVQGDGNTRAVEAELLANGASWIPDADWEAAVTYRKPDGKKGLYNLLDDGSSAIAISGSTATVILAAQMLTEPGTVRAAIVFNNQRLDQLTSFPFLVSVARNQFAGAQQSEDYIRLQWLEDKLSEKIEQLISTEQAVRAGVAAQEATTAAAAAQEQATTAGNAAASANAAASRADTAAAGADTAKESAYTAANSANTAAAAAQEKAASAENAAASANAAASRADNAAAGADTAKENAEAAASTANTAAAAAQAVVDGIVPEVEQLRSDLTGITPDDAAVDGKPWTSKHIVDTLCPPFSETGNPVQCYPVENYPLGVKIRIDPKQEGEGDPSPENVRPITGTVAVQIVHSNDAGESNTDDIDLPETVYGGTLDVDTGLVTVDTICETVTGAESSRFIDEPTDKQFSFILKKTSDSGVSSHYKSIGNIDKNNGIFGVYLSVTYKAIFNTGFDTLDEWKAYLSEQYAAGTPVQICYKLVNPYTIQLGLHQITAFSGVNTIYTDADGVVVTGAEDPKHTITELKNAILSLGGNI